MTKNEQPFLSDVKQLRERARASLERGTPFMAQRLRTWMESLWPGHSLEEYWTHPIGFPLLLAPWWLEETLRRKSDSSFQLELVA